jgi:hypothetical protein
MAVSRLLYFTSEQHTLYKVAGKTLEIEARFSADEVGITELRNYLASLRKGSLLGLLADLAGEDFHEDQLPYLRGRDREAVIQRRLAQRYRDTRLSAAISLGIVSTERRNERLLLASFTNTQQFGPWLDAIAESSTRLTGVYSIPTVAPSLVSRVGPQKGKCIVVSVNQAGLRQCFVDDGRLRFARLERTSSMTADALAIVIRSETLRLIQYLTTLRAIPRDAPPIQVIAIAPKGTDEALAAALVPDARALFRVVGSAEAERKIGLKGLPDGSQSEALYIYLAARKPPREQFAQSEDRRAYFLWQVQRGIIAAGGIAFAACALFAGVRWLDVIGMRDRSVDLRHEARAADSEYQRIVASFPVTQTTTDNLKATVLEFQRIAGRTATPDAALAFVSTRLEQFPEIELDSLSWSVGQSAESARGGGASAIGGTGTTSEFVEISGRIQTIQRSDYRAITELVQKFGSALGTGPQFRLLRLQLPSDISSEGTLTGEVGAVQNAESPRFTAVLSRRMN